MAARKCNTRKTRKSQTITDEGVLKVFDALKTQPLPFDEDAAKDMADAMCPGPIERIALFFLARPFKDMVETLNRDRALAADFARIAHLIDARLRAGADFDAMLKAAQLRIRFALCEREDMQELLEEAKSAQQWEASNVIRFPVRGNVGQS